MNLNVAHDICSSYDWIDSYSIGALQSVLSHNNEPTSLQASSLASSKEHIDLTHHRLTEDIDSLENALQLLRKRRRVLKSLSVRHAGALSTFRRLPNEILLQIFLHACGDDYISVDDHEDEPWKLRAVCQKWASIVENCSRFWCNIAINLTKPNVDPTAIAQALKFCGSRPIQMKLSVMPFDGEVQWDRLRVVLDTIVSSSPRWDSLIIQSYKDLFTFVVELFPLLRHKLPRLRSLKLWGMTYQNFDSDWLSSTPRLTALLTAPLLENVHIELTESDLFDELFDILPIPCQQIQRLSCDLTGGDRDAPHIPQFLLQEKFPLLERCLLMSSGACIESSTQVSTRVKHDGVVHLVASRADVLDAFSFPALRTFALGDPDSKPTGPGHVEESCAIMSKRASDMLSASRCSLVSLVLSYAFPLVDEFLPLLDVIPTLEILDMRVIWENGTARDEVLCKLFTALGNRRNNSAFSLLPALRDLRLSIAASHCMTLFSDDYSGNYPPPRRSFRFVSQVFGAITERSKCPSDFQAFSFTLSNEDKSCWYLSESDVNQLQDLECTKVFLKGPVWGV